MIIGITASVGSLIAYGNMSDITPSNFSQKPFFIKERSVVLDIFHFYIEYLIPVVLAFLILNLIGVVGGIGFLRRMDSGRKLIRFISAFYFVVTCVCFSFAMALVLNPYMWLNTAPLSLGEYVGKIFNGTLVFIIQLLPFGYVIYQTGQDSVKQLMVDLS